ncbi:MAG: DegT/DnrJ/EryC1/StrS family aminotransferase, partial [Flavipsychrobacter sp.]
ELKNYLQQNGIQTVIHYPVPPHRQKAYGDNFERSSYSITEKIAETCLSLPISPVLNRQEAKIVTDAINAF